MTGIKFGTDGWRDLVDNGFTLDNVKGITQAICDYLKSNFQLPTPDSRLKVVVGYDTRLLSKEAAESVAEVAAGNGIQAFLTESFAPTPVVSLATVNRKAQGAIMVTASHNPPRYNGLKFKPSHGGSASKEITEKIEKHYQDNFISHKKPLVIQLEKARGEKLLHFFDPKKEYCSTIINFVDKGAIKKARIKVAVDPMYGAAQGYLSEILGELGCDVTEIHNRFDPTFKGINPEPILPHLKELQKKVLEEHFEVGLGLDGDADRVGAIDERGNFVNSHQIFALLLKGLIEKGMRGEVVKTVSTTQMIDILAKKGGLPVVEVPVGFKHICERMLQGDVLIGGEESGGIGIRGHLPERDGILSALYLVELMAAKKKSLGRLIRDLQKDIGSFYYDRLDVEVDAAMKNDLSCNLDKLSPSKIAGEKVTKISRLDGNKFYFENGWLMLRVSGTEAVVRIYAEARSPAGVADLISEGKRILFQGQL